MSSARTQSQLWTATPISSLGRVFTFHFILESEMGRGNVQLVRTIISQIVLVVAIINESFEIQNLTKFPWFQIFLLYCDPINLVTTCFRLIKIGWRRSSMNVWLRLNRTSVGNFWIQSFFLRINKFHGVSLQLFLRLTNSSMMMNFTCLSKLSSLLKLSWS